MGDIGGIEQEPQLYKDLRIVIGIDDVQQSQYNT
jgi:hypothetical protein